LYRFFNCCFVVKTFKNVLLDIFINDPKPAKNIIIVKIYESVKYWTNSIINLTALSVIVAFLKFVLVISFVKTNVIYFVNKCVTRSLSLWWRVLFFVQCFYTKNV
jgi:hypothetical protein